MNSWHSDTFFFQPYIWCQIQELLLRQLLDCTDTSTGIGYRANTAIINVYLQKFNNTSHQYHFIALGLTLHETEDCNQRAACHFLSLFRILVSSA